MGTLSFSPFLSLLLVLVTKVVSEGTTLWQHQASDSVFVRSRVACCIHPFLSFFISLSIFLSFSFLFSVSFSLLYFFAARLLVIPPPPPSPDSNGVEWSGAGRSSRDSSVHLLLRPWRRREKERGKRGVRHRHLFPFPLPHTHVRTNVCLYIYIYIPIHNHRYSHG